MIGALVVESRQDRADKDRLLDVAPDALQMLVDDMRAGESAWSVAMTYREAGVTYGMTRMLRKALHLPKASGQPTGSRKVAACNEALACDPDSIPAIPARIMAALECEPEDVRERAIEAWLAQ